MSAHDVSAKGAVLTSGGDTPSGCGWSKPVSPPTTMSKARRPASGPRVPNALRLAAIRRG
jgi:hypothetical protein